MIVTWLNTYANQRKNLKQQQKQAKRLHQYLPLQSSLCSLHNITSPQKHLPLKANHLLIRARIIIISSPSSLISMKMCQLSQCRVAVYRVRMGSFPKNFFVPQTLLQLPLLELLFVLRGVYKLLVLRRYLYTT